MKAILSKEEAQAVAISYTPPQFPQTASRAALEFVQFRSSDPSAFRIERIVADQTGITELERLSIQERVEQEALIRLKAAQEQAYQEAYRLGLDEGRERAYSDKRSELEEKLSNLHVVLEELSRLKTDLVASNETHIVSLIYCIAKRVLMAELTTRPELVLEVVKKSIEAAQSEEALIVRLSPSDLAFIESIRATPSGKDFEDLERVKLEASPNITSGGCIVETNYGDVTATIEQRLGKVWTAINEKLPIAIEKTTASNGGEA